MDLFAFVTIRQLAFSDVLDILIIWIVVYNLLKFIQGSRAQRMTLGLISLFVVQLLAQRFGLEVLSKTIGSLFNIIPIAVIVLFQEEIRKMLASIGSTPILSRQSETDENALDRIFQAALYFSKHRIGALIVFEGDDGLKSYIERGTQLDAIPTYELLLDIFNTKSILHDGAVIISKSRIASAACVLPLSENRDLPKHWGTRHRAAIGMSEAADSLVLVVSEESGRVSLAKNGQMQVLPENTMSQLKQVFFSLNASDSDERLDLLRSLWKNVSAKSRSEAGEEVNKEDDKKSLDGASLGKRERKRKSPRKQGEAVK